MKEKLYEIVAEALSSSGKRYTAADITPETGAEGCPDWDSLAHMRIFVAVEERMGIHFPMLKLQILNSVAEYERELTERGII